MMVGISCERALHPLHENEVANIFKKYFIKNVSLNFRKTAFLRTTSTLSAVE